MAQKLKPYTRIPTGPKPTLLKTATSSSNLNSVYGNPSGRNIRPPITRPTHLRRSKSVTDFRSLNTRANFDVKPSSTFAAIKKNPLKRPAVTGTSSAVLNKISKTNKEPPNPVAKTVQPKFAPYDYKGRFNHLKEIHEKLKIQYRELKEKHEEIADQNEDLLIKSEQQQNNFDSLQEIYEKLKNVHDNLKIKYESSANKLESLQNKSNELETELIEKRKAIECTTEQLKNITVVHSTIQTRLCSTEKQLEEHKKDNTYLREELIALFDENRKIRNTVQELKGNIRVFCRIRPPLASEKDKLTYDVNYLDETSIELNASKERKIEFTFDKVFGPTSTQKHIFEELSELVQSSLDGYNVCVFAYGQTGSGKTYTMEGENDPASLGMIPRTIDAIFGCLESLNRLGWTYKIKASFLEIYNENVIDLLDPKKVNLEIRMCDSKGTDVYVPSLTVENIHNANKLKSLMKIAQRNRAVAATENNNRSSRSHSVTKISMEGINEELGQKCTGNLNLIDLAGSEKFTTNETTRLRETTNINKSLSNLSNVILCLVKKTNHIPYRNSKLTHLLMPSLGGNSKTLMMVNISPLDDCYNESVNSLRFASTVNQCKTGPVRKQKVQT